MNTGKTETGFEFSIDPVALDDWELLEDLEAVARDGGRIVSAARRMLSDDQYSALKAHCTDDQTGRVSASKMTAEIISIFDKIKEIKNS